MNRLRRAVLAAVTCMSCGVAFGQTHTPACMFNRQN